MSSRRRSSSACVLLACAAGLPAAPARAEFRAYAVFNAGTLAGDTGSEALAINAAGHLAGSTDYERAFVFTDRAIQVGPTLSWAYGLSDTGLAAVTERLASHQRVAYVV